MSSRPPISAIVAVSENGYIGESGDLPWRLRDDMRWFMRRTRGASLIMGRRTFESMAGALEGRQNIVLTRQEDWSDPGAEVAHDIESAFAIADRPEIFIAGGEAVYQRGLPYATRIDLTRVHAEVEGDARFPAPDWSKWRRQSVERHEAGNGNDHPFTIEVWVRDEPEKIPAAAGARRAD